MSCVEISFIRNAKDEIFYLLSLFVQRLQEILDIIIFLIGREKTREKCMERFEMGNVGSE